MDLFDVLVARKYSNSGGGGGGSSIVNPINVTIVNNTGSTPSFMSLASDSNMSETYHGGFYIDADGIAIINTVNSGWMPTLSSGTNTLPTAYCLDNCMIYIADFMGEGYTYDLSGAVTKMSMQGMDILIVTGDCTITVS